MSRAEFGSDKSCTKKIYQIFSHFSKILTTFLRLYLSWPENVPIFWIWPFLKIVPNFTTSKFVMTKLFHTYFPPGPISVYFSLIFFRGRAASGFCRWIQKPQSFFSFETISHVSLPLFPANNISIFQPATVQPHRRAHLACHIFCY